jgi:hypothetical protein
VTTPKATQLRHRLLFVLRYDTSRKIARDPLYAGVLEEAAIAREIS